MKYEPTPVLSKQEVYAAMDADDGLGFSRALRSAAMYWSPEEFDDLIVYAAQRSGSPVRHWAISEAIATIVQARRIVPQASERILKSIPDGDLTSPSRDDALLLLRQANVRPE